MREPRYAVRLLALALGLALILASAATGARASSAIEDTYRETGPWSVETGSATADGGTYALFYPADLGDGGVRHPIVTWGNGTAATPANYTTLLTHLASWGFVVIASDSGMTGLGTEILDGALYLIDENANPASVFHRKLDVTRVGALGHSQGAGGTLNATIDAGGLITSAITVALPDPQYWTTPVPNMARFPSRTKLFFIRGTIDPLATEAAALGWYGPVPGVAAKAAQIDAGHNQVQFTDTRLTGYITAWLLFSLRDDAYARGAFFGTTPEIASNAAWTDVAAKVPGRRVLAGPTCAGGQIAVGGGASRLPALRAGAQGRCP